jgi:AraC family transcriptional regulator
MKETTNNEYHKSINKTIDFINKYLKKSIDLKRLVTVANLSEFHFYRIFKAYIILLYLKQSNNQWKILFS